ncbi:MAG: hypothetical protein GTO03_09485 [Planctomycetales bacterium]|nr:hypothetical protein [Planctomycetales bacterium]
MSYDGLIVKIHWCVRLRLFLPRGRELVAEQPFQLGAVPRVRTGVSIPAPHLLPQASATDPSVAEGSAGGDPPGEETLSAESSFREATVKEIP